MSIIDSPAALREIISQSCNEEVPVTRKMELSAMVYGSAPGGKKEINIPAKKTNRTINFI